MEQPALSNKQAKISHLANGLTVITCHQPSEQVYTGLVVSAGSRHEPKGQEGAAHFLEHMLFNETQAWDKEEHLARMHNMYGYGNAVTSPESTQYFYLANKEHLQSAIGMLADSMLQPKIFPDSVRMEAEIIATERSNQESSPGAIGYHLVNVLAYPGSRLANYGIGDPSSIHAITSEDLLAFKEKHYTAGRMTLIAVGDVNHDDICRLAEEKFNALPGSAPGEGAKDFPQPEYRGGYQVMENDNLTQTMLRIAYPISGRREGLREGYKDTLLSAVLGSRLWQTLRTRDGIVYSAGANVGGGHDYGLLTAGANVLPEHVQQATETMANELKTLSQHIVPEKVEELKKAEIGGMERSEDSPGGKANVFIGHMLNYGREFTLEERRQLMYSITVEELQKHAKKIFSQAPTIVAYGKDASKFASYEQVTDMLGYPKHAKESGLTLADAPKPRLSPGIARLLERASEGKVSSVQRLRDYMATLSGVERG